MSETKRPFSDLLVVELASVLAGPSVGQFFAELGARVIKIENIKSNGDVTRSWKLSSESKDNEVSAYFAAANWGKESVCIDLTWPKVKKAVDKILAKADVVLVGFKPGDAEKLGVDFKALSVANPKLVYGHITGYGANEPRAGYDAVLQAEAGFMYLNGEKGGRPLKMPVALIDLLAAHQLKEGLLTALYLQEKTGAGKYVEVSLLRTALSSLANQATNYLVAGQAPERLGSEHPNIVPYGTVFSTADGKDIVLSIGDDRQFQALCEVLGAEKLAQAPEYKTNKDRVSNRETLNEQLGFFVRKNNRADLLDKLIAKHVPAGAVYSIPEALNQTSAQPQLLQGEKMPGLRQIAFDMNGVEALSLTDPPGLGSRTWRILKEYGNLSDSELQELANQRLIYPADPGN